MIQTVSETLQEQNLTEKRKFVLWSFVGTQGHERAF